MREENAGGRIENFSPRSLFRVVHQFEAPFLADAARRKVA